MLWLITGKQSHQITACNIHEVDGKYQVWVERSNGKSMKLKESHDLEEIEVYKKAIDFAVANGHKSLELD